MRLIDADKLKQTVNDDINRCYRLRIDGVGVLSHFADEIEAQPTIDAVPVVRCQYCKHRIDDKDFASGHYCTKRPSNGGRFCEDNDFCSYGEKEKRMREKLIALFRDFFKSIYPEFVLNSLADHLLSNGVVVREKGEWVWDKKFGDSKCSICGGYDITVPAFCRTCGADMRGANDD